MKLLYIYRVLLKESKIDHTNYFNATMGKFRPVPASDAKELMSQYIAYRRKRNKPDYLELNGEQFSVDFESQSKNAFFRSRSNSFYFISKDKKRLIRISDHWSSTGDNNPNSRKLNVGFIRSCHWSIEGFIDSFYLRLPGEKYDSRLVAGEILFSELSPSGYS